MNKYLYLLAVGVGSAMLVAACADDSGNLTNGGRVPTRNSSSGDTGEDTNSLASATPGGSDTTTGTPAPATNSAEGLAFYTASVHPTLATKCGQCHGTAGPGPNWLTASDANATYKSLFSQGYVVAGSRITVKGTHDGSSTNALNTDEIATYNKWVAMETSGGGAVATVNVLAKLGDCFDQTKFDAMKMDQWGTTQRTANNNTNNVTPWNENADNCTGCKNNTPCSTCHSADPATNFVNAVGSPIFDKNYTFEETKKTQPAFISKYFGIGPDGKPVASDGIKKKSDSTMQSKAYTHPMFKLTDTQQTALDAFVTDAISKYNAGTCTTTPATTNP